MRLDRNIEGRGNKYGLILNRKLADIADHDGSGRAANKLAAVREAIATLEREGLIDWGDTPETEFFLIRLRDMNAQAALRSYAGHARQFDQEYSQDVMELSNRSGLDHPNCKVPD